MKAVVPVFEGLQQRIGGYSMKTRVFYSSAEVAKMVGKALTTITHLAPANATEKLGHDWLWSREDIKKTFGAWVFEGRRL